MGGLAAYGISRTGSHPLRSNRHAHVINDAMFYALYSPAIAIVNLDQWLAAEAGVELRHRVQLVIFAADEDLAIREIG
jgi:hypothetical protein